MSKKPQQYDVTDLAEFMRKAKANHKPFVFFTGAGCSVTAGIPLAKKLIAEMNQQFPTELKLLSDIDRQDYGKCMAEIGRDDRRHFLKGYIDKAKINWAHIALACLVEKGYISRVLTFNFDNLLARSCGLLGLYPATYDLSAANLNLYHLIDNPAIVHLHGQSHGFAQLNSDEETSTHAQQLSQFICATLNESPALFIGYSGQADAFFPQVKEHYAGQHRLFWVDMAEQAPLHVTESILKTSLAHYMRCADGADLFLIELAQKLDCFPPMIFNDPYAHLLEELGAVTAYPQRNEQRAMIGEASLSNGSIHSSSSQDILQGIRQRLQEARQRENELEHPNYLELYLEGKYEQLIEQARNRDDMSLIDQVWLARAYLGFASQIYDYNDKIIFYSDLVARFGDSCEPELQEEVAKALFNQGVALGQLNRYEESIPVYDDLINRFGTSDELVLQEQVANAIINKGCSLNELNRPEEAIPVYDDLINRFRNSDELVLQKGIANALFNKGVTLGQINRFEESINVYDDLVTCFGSSDESVFHDYVASALVNKAITLDQLNQFEGAIYVYDNVINLFGSSDELVLQEQVAKTLVNKSIDLIQLNQHEYAIHIYDDLINRFGNSDELVLQEQVAKGMVSKGFTLDKLNRTEEAISVYDEVIARFGTSSESILQQQVSDALNGKGFALLIKAKVHWQDQTTAHACLTEALPLLQQAQAKGSAERQAVIVGNLAYVSWLLEQPEPSKKYLRQALDKGGESLYQATLGDVAINPIPPDAGFQKLLEQIWHDIKTHA